MFYTFCTFYTVKTVTCRSVPARWGQRALPGLGAAAAKRQERAANEKQQPGRRLGRHLRAEVVTVHAIDKGQVARALDVVQNVESEFNRVERVDRVESLYHKVLRQRSGFLPQKI